ncbi:docking protein 1 isoform X2 [Nelusetta ayraudi]|uniref:docking protein 1 isoform X2 n=1 Tax=Nelusetta ayraudi TaxID=303726 RepID=UPI003F727CE3
MEKKKGRLLRFFLNPKGRSELRLASDGPPHQNRESVSSTAQSWQSGDSVGVRRHHQYHLDRKIKVIRLSELLSVVRLPPNAEACPMDNMSAFCVETQERTMVFAALKDDCVDWVEKLCHSTFRQSSPQLHMEENQIYASTDQMAEFQVVVQMSEAATRCNLQGSYWLQVDSEEMRLKDVQKKNVVREWPYKLLRRYGADKSSLTIEAGRRCESGPGSFTFETPQAERIFSMIQTNIKQKTSGISAENPNPEADKRIRAHSPLPRPPDLGSLTLENKVRMQEKTCSPSEESSQPPITLMPLPLIPVHDSPSAGQSDAEYADPADCIQASVRLQPGKALYVDPASILPLQPPGSLSPSTSESLPGVSPDSVYSEVYDKLIPVQTKQPTMSPAEVEEPIYTVPMSTAGVKEENKPDPFAHLYAQVCKTKAEKRDGSVTPADGGASRSVTASPANAAANPTTSRDQDDVIYENLGII